MKTMGKFFQDLKQFNEVKMQGKNLGADMTDVEPGINANMTKVELDVIDPDPEKKLTAEAKEHARKVFITYFSNKGYKLFNDGESRFKLVF